MSNQTTNAFTFGMTVKDIRRVFSIAFECHNESDTRVMRSALFGALLKAMEGFDAADIDNRVVRCVICQSAINECKNVSDMCNVSSESIKLSFR